MAMEKFRKAAKLDMKMVAFGNGNAEVVATLLGNHVDCTVGNPRKSSRLSTNPNLGAGA